jgi:hypothetical protein
MVTWSRARALWFGVIAAGISGACIAACESDDAAVELPRPCTRCKPSGSEGKNFNPSTCDPNEVEIDFDACATHACCAPKSWDDAGPCMTALRTIECSGGTACFLSGTAGEARANVCGSIDAATVSCGSISCAAPCTCTQSTPPACLCPSGSCLEGSVKRSDCYVGQVCTPTDIPSCVAPERTDGGVECGWIRCAPPCTCSDASASACSCP